MTPTSDWQPHDGSACPVPEASETPLTERSILATIESFRCGDVCASEAAVKILNHHESCLRSEQSARELAEKERDALLADKKEVVRRLNITAAEGHFDGYDEDIELWRNVDSFYERCWQFWKDKHEAEVTTAEVERDTLRAECERLRARLDYIRNDQADSVAVRFALEASDAEIDAVIEDTKDVQ